MEEDKSESETDSTVSTEDEDQDDAEGDGELQARSPVRSHDKIQGGHQLESLSQESEESNSDDDQYELDHP